MESNPGAAAPTSPDEKGAVEGREEQEAVALKKGPWTAAEDAMLVDHVQRHGEGNWNAVQRMTGLLRCGKSCRLRWTNHLRPNLKKGSFSPDEEMVIAQLHAQLGNKWARMAAHLPGRTDNEIKNYWNTRTKRRQRAGLPVYPPEVQLQLALSKRCRYDDRSPLSSECSAQTLQTGAAASAGYTSARPAPLDLARQLALSATNQTMQFLSAPTSPWAKSFARNAHYLQFAHSSPVSPSTPLHPVTPDLSLGYGQSGIAPLSPSPGPRLELPSNQFAQALPTSPCSGIGGGGGPPVPDHQPNAASLEKMLQELHEAIKVDPPPANGGDAVLERHDDGGEDKPEGELKDDIDTLFDLMIPPFNDQEEPAPPAPASNHSGSTSQQSSDDQDPCNVDLGVDHLPAAGAIRSPDQEWSLDGVCQWSNVSRIC